MYYLKLCDDNRVYWRVCLKVKDYSEVFCYKRKIK